MRLWNWILGNSQDLGYLSDEWLSNRKRLARYVRWDCQQKKCCIVTHAFRPGGYGALEYARSEMKRERHLDYLRRIHDNKTV